MSTPEDRVGLELALVASVDEIEAISLNASDDIVAGIERLIGPLGNEAQVAVGVTAGSAASCFFIFSLGDAVDCIVRTLLDAIIQAVSAVVANQFTLADLISAAADRILDTIDGVIGGLGETILDAIEGQTDELAGVIRDVFGGIEGALEGLTDAVGGVAGEVLGGIGQVLGEQTEAIEAVINDAFGGVGEGISEILDGIDGLAGEIVDGIRAEISGIEGAVTGEGERTREAIRAGIETTVAGQEDLSGQLAESTRVILEGQITQADRVITDTTTRVETAVMETVEPVAIQVAQIQETVTGLSGPLGTIGDVLGTISTAGIFGPVPQFGSFLLEGIDSAFGGLIDRIEGGLEARFRAMLIALGVPGEIADRFTGAARAANPESFITTLAILAPIIGFTLPLIASQALSPVITQLVQEINRAVTPSLLTPEQLITLLTRGQISPQEFDDQLAQEGFNEQRRSQLFQLRKQFLGVRDLAQLWLRGELSEADLNVRLAEIGVFGREASEVKTLSFPLPSVQDLVTMAVREVFSPEVVSRFGQGQDFPPEFEARARQIGISPEIARDFWAAHWALPSATQGFQMFHRGIIDRADLEVLLRSLDVMPFWRDRLIQVAFRPLTRVDVRRMFGLGLIDRARVVKSFTDLGFSPEDAELNTEFVEAFTGDQPVEERGEAEGLTRAAVLDFFADGLIDRGQTEQFLQGLGFSEAATELFITARELQIERGERQQEIRLTIEQAAAGQITFAQAEDRLSAAQLTPAEIGRALAELRREEARRVTLPSTEQLTAMLGANVIDERTFRDAMGRRGFADRWIDAFLELEG